MCCLIVVAVCCIAAFGLLGGCCEFWRLRLVLVRVRLWVFWVLTFRGDFGYVGLVVGICVAILLYGSCEILVPGLWVVFGCFAFVSWV